MSSMIQTTNNRLADISGNLIEKALRAAMIEARRKSRLVARHGSRTRFIAASVSLLLSIRAQDRSKLDGRVRTTLKRLQKAGAVRNVSRNGRASWAYYTKADIARRNRAVLARQAAEASTAALVERLERLGVVATAKGSKMVTVDAARLAALLDRIGA